MIILLTSKKFEKSKTNYIGADYLFWSAIICSFLISHSHSHLSFSFLICQADQQPRKYKTATINSK